LVGVGNLSIRALRSKGSIFVIFSKMRRGSTRKTVREACRLAAPSARALRHDGTFRALREYAPGNSAWTVERAPGPHNQVGTGLFGQRAIDHHGVEIDQTGRGHGQPEPMPWRPQSAANYPECPRGNRHGRRIVPSHGCGSRQAIMQPNRLHVERDATSTSCCPRL